MLKNIQLVGSLALIAGIFLVSGCGGDSSSGTGSSGSGYLATVEDRVQANLEGDFGKPPTVPTSPKDDQKLFMISCGEAFTGCAEFSNGVEDAGSLLGWDVTVIDSKADPALAGNAIRQAIAAKADLIAAYLLDCANVKQPLKEASQAGIPVVAAESFDCNETGSGPAQYAAKVDYSGGRTYPQWIADYGAGQADGIIDAIDGQGKVLAFTNEETDASRVQSQALMEGLNKCEGCEIEEIPISFAELFSGKLQGIAEQALVENPDTKAIGMLADGQLTGGVGAAIQSTGRDGEIYAMAGEGLPANMDLLRSGRQQDAGFGLSLQWEAYAAVDALIRSLNGEEPQNSGIGLQMYDSEHNVPESGGYEPPVDFRSAYEKAWGVQ